MACEGPAASTQPECQQIVSQLNEDVMLLTYSWGEQAEETWSHFSLESRVCVKADSLITEEITERFPSSTETANLNAMLDLNIWSKDVTDCLAERKELMKSLLQFQENERLESIPGKRKRKNFMQPVSSHLYNLDFVVDDEKCVS